MSTFFNFPLPLWAYILLWVGMFCIIILFACLYAKECNANDAKEALLRETKQGEALEIGQPELAELNRDYAQLGLIVEDHTQQLSDAQKEFFGLDERLSKLEQRSTHIHIGISKLFQVCDDDYTGPDDEEEEDSDIATLPTPLSGWLDQAKGLDEL